MIAYVVDASALLKTVLIEPDSASMIDFIGMNHVGVPPIARAEFANVLHRFVKRKTLSRDGARRALGEVMASAQLLPETDEEARLTLDLAIELDHPAQDCRYLAAAIARKVPLITADEGFVRKARAAGHDARSIAELTRNGG
jgi:predicted nucleic acid-binding protein